MSRKLNVASAIAVSAMIVSIVASTAGAGARAESKVALPAAPPAPQVSPEATPSSAPAPLVASATETPEPQATQAAPRAASLAALVAAQPQPAALPRELKCLASAIYFESKSESLAGQLAVGRVIVGRSKSGRFPDSYCGVVFQRSQFSFVRGGSLPSIPVGSRQWKTAVAIAQIAHANTWKSPVEGALYFHAARVSPGWGRARVAQIDHQVFYR